MRFIETSHQMVFYFRGEENYENLDFQEIFLK